MSLLGFRKMMISFISESSILRLVEGFSFGYFCSYRLKGDLVHLTNLYQDIVKMAFFMIALIV